MTTTLENPTLISTWEELAELPESETHYLEIGACSGWIVAKNPISNKHSDRKKYLSTPTFYEGIHEYSTKLLQSCGFNVVLANWDAE
ncbi:hypothetical protein NVP1121O_147 [Vibrio phage 1.121.O._10N.286.46.C4]|nr:hypothetical protein NVP1121O_147 [Vibrio phage 1.121.O._10N.286.46.C4]